MNELQTKIDNRTAVVGILGLGYVGIPLAQRISEVGFRVVGFDVLQQRVAELNGGHSPIKHIPDSAIDAMLQQGFAATADFSRSAECDVLIICVPTPLDKFREPDLSFVIATMKSIVPHMRRGQLISLESTTWPGTTVEVLKPLAEGGGFKVGEDVYLVYSPEREDPGNKSFTTRTIPKVVGGVTETCLELGASLYSAFIDKVVRVSSTQTAEMVKLLENIHRSVNIGLVNELKIVCEKMGLDMFEIVDAAATKPFGFTPYYPGPGIGGHCIPIDPFYLTWKAREYGLHTRFIELAGEINASMPQYVVAQTVRALNEHGKTLKDARVLALGIAYKRDVDDMRESPSVITMELLRDWGADVHYSDPNLPKFPVMREHRFDLVSEELTAENLASFDVVMLLTDHTSFDYDLIQKSSRLIIDTRGRYRESLPNVRRA